MRNKKTFNQLLTNKIFKLINLKYKLNNLKIMNYKIIKIKNPKIIQFNNKRIKLRN
jgi:hypothetical protein